MFGFLQIIESVTCMLPEKIQRALAWFWDFVSPLQYIFKIRFQVSMVNRGTDAAQSSRHISDRTPDDFYLPHRSSSPARLALSAWPSAPPLLRTERRHRWLLGFRGRRLQQPYRQRSYACVPVPLRPVLPAYHGWRPTPCRSSKGNAEIPTTSNGLWPVDLCQPVGRATCSSPSSPC